MTNESKKTNQGEGNREAAEEYNESQREFVQSGQVEEQEQDRRQLNAEEKREALAAEREGKKRAKEKDPEVPRDYSQKTS